MGRTKFLIFNNLDNLEKVQKILNHHRVDNCIDLDYGQPGQYFLWLDYCNEDFIFPQFLGIDIDGSINNGR